MLNEKWRWRIFMWLSYVLSAPKDRIKGIVRENLLYLKDIRAWLRTGLTNGSFIYDSDPVFGAVNHIPSPSDAESVIDGDCDDWASKVYNYLELNGFSPYLLTYFTKPLKPSHTVVIFKDRYGEWRMIDWGRVSMGWEFAYETIFEQQAHLDTRENTPQIYSVHVARFDYIYKHRWVRVAPKDVI